MLLFIISTRANPNISNAINNILLFNSLRSPQGEACISHAAPFEEWEDVEVYVGEDDGARLRMKIALLGDRRRREGIQGRFKELVAHGGEVVDAFGEGFTPLAFSTAPI